MLNGLSGREAREIEPVLSPRVTAAIHCVTDYQVDNRQMVTALQRAYQTCGGVLYENSAVEKIVIGKWHCNRCSNTRRFPSGRHAYSRGRMLVCRG